MDAAMLKRQVLRDLTSMESAPSDVEEYEWMYAPRGFGKVRVLEDRSPRLRPLDGQASPVRDRYRDVHPIYASHDWEVGWDSVARVVVVWR